MEDLPASEGLDLIRTQCLYRNSVAVSCSKLDLIGFAISVDENYRPDIAWLK